MNPNRGSWRDLCFRNPQLLTLAIIVIGLAGASAYNTLPRIEDPRITTRNALVLTQFPGASAERVEALVTEPLEDALREIEEIKTIRSTSRASISLISIELDDAIGPGRNEQVFSRIRDKLGDAEPLLPDGAGKPAFDDERGAYAFSVVVALGNTSAGNGSLGVLTRLADELADRLRRLPGAERVRIYGDVEEEITVTVNRGELAAQQLTAARIAARIAAADPKSAAGAMRGSERDLLLEVAGELDSTAQIRDLVLREGERGRMLRLGDVATVERGWRLPPDATGYVNGKRVVFVAAAASADTRLDVWQAKADDAIAGFASELGSGIAVETIFRQNDYTNARLASLGGNLLMGALVVMLVVLVALGWRAALIVGAALPLSAAATLFGLTFFGQQIHQMTIFGMIIAIGLLIDNAIVVTDEVQTRRRRGESGRAAVAGTVGHLFAPLLASTVTTILGFMPIFLLPGNIGDFVGPIAISVVLALAASFLISLTIIAALGGRFLGTSASGTDSNGGRWWQRGIRLPRVEAAGAALLGRAFARPGLAAATVAVLPVLGFVLAGTLKLEFFPPAERDQFEVEVYLADDAALDATGRTMAAIASTIRERDGVTHVSWLAGGSHPQVYYNRVMDQDNNAAYAHAIVTVAEAEHVSDLVTALQTDLDTAYPAAQVIVAPFAQGPPVDAPVGFRISGPSLAALDELGTELRRIMHEVPGIGHTRASVDSRAQLDFVTDQHAAERTGLSLDALSLELRGNLEGLTGGSMLEDLEELPVRVRYDDGFRGSAADIASMPFLAGNGRDWVPPDAIGSMRLVPKTARITRYDGERVNTIHGWVRPGVLPIEASDAVRARLDAAGFALPPGYRLELEGDSDAQRDAVGQLTTYLPVLVMLMVATLVLSFRSGTAAAIIGLVAGLSAGLGMLSLWLSGYNLGFNPIIGSAGLVGVAINGAIVVLAALKADNAASSGDKDAIVRVTMREARHVLATTFTTIGGFLPLLLFTGGQFWPPLAVVIAGGVGFSVMLSLVFAPAMFRLLLCSRQRVAAGQPAWSGTAAVLVVAVLLGGCAVGPDYVEPEPNIDDNWASGESAAVDADLAGWWKHFDDPLLADYVETALEANRDVDVALARLAEARALGRRARAPLYPSLNANAEYTDFKLSAESPALIGTGERAPVSGELYDAGFDAAWELDFFGRNRRTAEAAAARIEATEASLRAVRLSVIADVVRSLVELRGAQQRLKVAVENERLQSETLDVVARRVDSGLAPELDLLNAKAQRDSTRSTLPQLEARIRALAYRLATLTARSPAVVYEELAEARPIPQSTQPLAAGLRSDILRRRPDVSAAERQLAAATAATGAAIAERFPRLVLNGRFGWQAMSPGGIGDAATESTALLGILELPVFTGGRLEAQADAARARQDAAFATYRQTVLIAVEESEAALVRYRRARQSRQHLARAAAASAEAATIARRLYDSGLADFLSVLDADRRRLLAEDALAGRRTDVATNLVAVYKALGAL